MKTMYEVIEERGCGIEYTVFRGTLANCKMFVKSELENQNNSDYDDDNYYNGNGQPFTWKIRKDIF